MRRRGRGLAKIKREWQGFFSCDEIALTTTACKSWAIVSDSILVEDRLGIDPGIRRLVGTLAIRGKIACGNPASSEVVYGTGAELCDQEPVWVHAAVAEIPKKMSVATSGSDVISIFDLDYPLWLQRWDGLPLDTDFRSWSVTILGTSEFGQRLGYPDHYVIPFDIPLKRRQQSEMDIIFMVEAGNGHGTGCCGWGDSRIETVRWNVNGRILFQQG